jgi:hypothetical protein
LLSRVGETGMGRRIWNWQSGSEAGEDLERRLVDERECQRRAGCLRKVDVAWKEAVGRKKRRRGFGSARSVDDASILEVGKGEVGGRRSGGRLEGETDREGSGYGRACRKEDWSGPRRIVEGEDEGEEEEVEFEEGYVTFPSVGEEERPESVR